MRRKECEEDRAKYQNMWQRRRRRDGEETDRPAYWYDVKCDYQTSLKQEVASHHEGTNAQRKRRNS